MSVGVTGCLSSGGGDSPKTATTSETETTIPEDSTTSETETTIPDDPTSETTTSEGPPTVREVESVGWPVPQPLAVESPDADPFLSLAVGSCKCGSDLQDTKPHAVWIWNDTAETLTVELELTADGTTVLDESYEFPAYTPLALELRAQRRYELVIRAGDRESTVTVPRSRIDCNDSGTQVVIRDDEIEHSSVTTELACSTTTA